MMRNLARFVDILKGSWTGLISFCSRFLSKPLGAILILGLLEGIVCLIAIPAWWHYDEPGHFEYVWLAAHSPPWPTDGQYDQSMRREMAGSMLQVGWYRIRNIKVDLKSPEPIPIGVTQVGDQPGYYFLASLPLRLMPSAAILVQYYAARSVSLLLYLLIIAAIWFGAGEVFPGDHPLRWMTAVFVALLPAFADTMVSVNNDVGAVLAGSLFLWASLSLILYGFSVRKLLFLGATLVLCYLSKSTAWFSFLLAPLVVVLAFLRGRFAAVVWGTVAIVMVLASALALRWGGPKAWYQASIDESPVRGVSTSAPLGSATFKFDAAAPAITNQLLQVVPPDQVKLLKGKTATLGAWLWADQPTQAGPFFIRFFRQSGDNFDSPAIVAPATTQPVFHELDFLVPGDAINAIVYLQQDGRSTSHNAVYFDGLVLTPGKFDSSTPSFGDADGTHGNWSGQAFTNVLRNASAEEASLQIRQRVNDRTAGVLAPSGISLPLLLETVQDWSGSRWYYRNTIATLFRTFWSSLAGDKAFLASSYVSYFLGLLTVMALLGALIRLWLHRGQVRWDVIGFLGLALLIPWLLAVARSSTGFLLANPLSPWARYAYPAILPTALLLCSGWLEWLEILPSRFRMIPETRKSVFFAVMTGISVFVILNAIQVFHPDWWYGWISVGLLFVFQYVIYQLLRKVRV